MIMDRCQCLVQHLIHSLSLQPALTKLPAANIAACQLSPHLHQSLPLWKVWPCHSSSAPHGPFRDDETETGTGSGSGRQGPFRRPGGSYVERVRSRRLSVLHFLCQELALSGAEADRMATRYRQLAAVGVHVLTENLTFLTDSGVRRDHLRDDVDILCASPGDLVRVRELVGRLPGADFRLYYPLSRTAREKLTDLFRRLPHRNSNLVQHLAQTLHLPVLTVCRAASRISSHLVLSTNKKIIRNAELLMELGVVPAELARSLYALTAPPAQIWRRHQQCSRLGLSLRPFYLAVPEAEFQRRLALGGLLTERTADAAALMAHRMGVSRELVAQRLAGTDLLRHLTTARFEEVTALLEGAGYAPRDVAAALPVAYQCRPELLRRRLERARRLGCPQPTLSVLRSPHGRFERIARRWAREHGERGKTGRVETDTRTGGKREDDGGRGEEGVREVRIGVGDTDADGKEGAPTDFTTAEFARSEGEELADRYQEHLGKRRGSINRGVQ